VQISPDKFDETGTHFYLTPAVIKTGKVEEISLRPITEAFFKQHERRLRLNIDDIVLGSSGEGIGKVGLYDSALPSIISQFVMRIRFNEDTNSRFAWYFMQSIMFQAQIEREKRGTSLPNIFPGQVERMLIVACPRDWQDAIADAVTAELQKREAALRAIAAKRKEIDALIEAAILNELKAA